MPNPALRRRIEQPLPEKNPCVRGELYGTGCYQVMCMCMENWIRTTKVSSQHQIQHKEAVFVILERIP